MRAAFIARNICFASPLSDEPLRCRDDLQRKQLRRRDRSKIDRLGAVETRIASSKPIAFQARRSKPARARQYIRSRRARSSQGAARRHATPSALAMAKKASISARMSAQPDVPCACRSCPVLPCIGSIVHDNGVALRTPNRAHERGQYLHRCGIRAPNRPIRTSLPARFARVESRQLAAAVRRPSMVGPALHARQHFRFREDIRHGRRQVAGSDRQATA